MRLEGTSIIEDFTDDNCLFDTGDWQIIPYDDTNILINNGSGTSNLATSVSFDIMCSHIEITYNVDSESSYDYLAIYIDGSQKVKKSGTGNSVTTYSTNLTYGKHTIKFYYKKDSGGNKGRDRAEIYSIKYTTVADINYLIKEDDILKGIDSNVTDETSETELILKPISEDNVIKIPQSILNKILQHSDELLTNSNITLQLYTDLPEVIVNQKCSYKTTKYYKSGYICNKDYIDFNNDMLSGISSIKVDGACDEGSLLKFVVITDDDSSTYNSFTGTVWEEIDKTSEETLLEKGMSLDVINNLTEEQLALLSCPNKHIKFYILMKKQSEDSTVYVKDIKVQFKELEG